MVDCASLKEDPNYEQMHISTKLLVESISNTKKGTKFWCPKNLESLIVRGHYGAKYFDYARIVVKGCDLGQECYDDQKLMNQSINYIGMRAHPSLLSDDKNEVISYTPDQTFFKYLDPNNSQQTNIYMMESTITMKDNIFDIFDTSETEVPLFEEASRVDYYKRYPDNVKFADREYFKIYLRANNE
jgi:hypothetical protein